MQLLRSGSSGTDVESWQTFLRSHAPGQASLKVDGTFGKATLAATVAFQRSVNGLDADGIVGPMTRAAAIARGFVGSVAWPEPPAFGPINETERARLFGTFTFEPAPSAGNPEGIRITDRWASDNIVIAHVPQLVGVLGAAKGGAVMCHRLAAPRLVELFERWERAGLRGRVLAWAGMWSARFIRGSRSVLSNHAWGTAFDINVAWNPLGSHGAPPGAHGSVADLIPIAHELGWYSGSYFASRPDPMHFELARL